jgi:4-hydroxybutyrate CoA-transferase
MEKCNSAAELIQYIRSGNRVFVQGGAATPNTILNALTEQTDRLKNVELIHLHTMGPALYAKPDFRTHFRVSNLFVGSNMRSHMNQEEIDYLPCFLSEIPALFRSHKRSLDVAVIHVSPPDIHGFCSLGTSVDVTRAAVDTAQVVLAQINPRMPRVHGDGVIHSDQINYFINVDEALPETPPADLTDVETKIGQFVSELIVDGSTIQVGIGALPEATLKALKRHRHLGVHTEMWSDGVLELIKSGVIDNSLKTIHPGKTVAGFAIGTRELYDFMNDNPSVLHLDIGYVNNPSIIARNETVAAINSAVEIDLTGQVCSDSVGSRIISGVGGQMDFIRGASLSKGGMPIIALTSRTRSGIPRIVSVLKKGAGVVTTRAHIHYVVTEYGVCDLFGRTLSERARALIEIAHPKDRENLSREWHDHFRNL